MSRFFSFFVNKSITEIIYFKLEDIDSIKKNYIKDLDFNDHDSIIKYYNIKREDYIKCIYDFRINDLYYYELDYCGNSRQDDYKKSILKIATSEFKKLTDKISLTLLEIIYSSGEIDNRKISIGNYNKGLYNIGNNNLGNRNIGKYNDKHENIGDFNKGEGNIGSYNEGNYNIGDGNKGHNNKGSYNNGNINIGTNNEGNCNIGSYNEGNYNIGNYNIGSYHLGHFNLEDNERIHSLFSVNKSNDEKYYVFDELVDKTFHDRVLSISESILVTGNILEIINTESETFDRLTKMKYFSWEYYLTALKRKELIPLFEKDK